MTMVSLSRNWSLWCYRVTHRNRWNLFFSFIRYVPSVQVTRMVKSLQEAYPGVAAIVETDLNLAQVTCADFDI